jgi:hypothetical protein
MMTKVENAHDRVAVDRNAKVLFVFSSIQIHVEFHDIQKVARFRKFRHRIEHARRRAPL